MSCILSSKTQGPSKAGSVSFAPVTALGRLLKHIAIHFDDSPTLLLEGLMRILGMPITTPLYLASLTERQYETLWGCFQPFSHSLDAVIEHSTSLFVEEKQNLYKDDAQEMDRWSRILLGLPATLVSGFNPHHLQAWVVDGLHAILDAIQSRPYGPLAWPSKPEGFCLGIRIFCAAEVAIEWSKKTNNVSDLQMILSALQAFQVEEIEQRLYPLWRQKLASLPQ